MSKMADLDWDIEYRACEGMGAREIARELDIPIALVLGKLAEMGVADLPQDPEIYSPYYG
jgi:hypothetical protein